MGIAKLLLLVLVALMASDCCITAEAKVHKHVFVIRAKRVKRQCKNHTIITVNGRFPGPTIEIRNGDTLEVLVKNHAKYNATIHWHGIRQMRTCWSDGPEYITQCPIKPGGSYRYRFTVNGQEGTLWWHAHSSWLRATVYGALIIRPALGTIYPWSSSAMALPLPETPILLGEWWNKNPIDVINAATRTGASPNVSDAFTINGLPGDQYKRCPNAADDDGIFTLTVKPGSTQLLRMVNAAVNTYLFFAVAGHKLTVVAADASYTKPHTTSVLMLGPGQTADVLLTANRSCHGGGRGRFYMAARAYSPGVGVPFDNTTTTAILHYSNFKTAATAPAPAMPRLPAFNDTQTANGFTFKLRSLASREHPVFVPTGKMDESLFFTVGLGLIPCAANRSCGGPNNTRFAASINNHSFVLPKRTSILQAARFNVKGVFRASFPDAPALKFDFTANNVSRALWAPRKGTRVKVLRYNATVQIVLQGTGIFASESHPLHLHGYDFYVVGMGNGNFNPNTDTANFNLLDPPMRNTVTVPVKGWAAIRFVADNPGAWLMHCHLDGHLGWGLATVFVVPDGAGSPLFRLQAPPRDLPAC